MNSSKNIFYKKYTLNLLILVVFLCLEPNNLQAQIQNNGSLYVSDNISIYLQSGDFSFGTESSTVSSRLTNAYGELQLGANATNNGV